MGVRYDRALVPSPRFGVSMANLTISNERKKITAIAFVPDSIVFRDSVVTRHPLEPRRQLAMGSTSIWISKSELNPTCKFRFAGL